MFDSGMRVDSSILKLWKYYGRCKDKKGQNWTFYTNSRTQFYNFKRKKKLFNMTFIEGSENKSYGVIKKLMGD